MERRRILNETLEIERELERTYQFRYSQDETNSTLIATVKRLNALIHRIALEGVENDDFQITKHIEKDELDVR